MESEADYDYQQLNDGNPSVKIMANENACLVFSQEWTITILNLGQLLIEGIWQDFRFDQSDDT